MNGLFVYFFLVGGVFVVGYGVEEGFVEGGFRVERRGYMWIWGCGRVVMLVVLMM